MRFEVPQFIEIEDKVFGPLTWRQFAYLGGASGLGAACFMYLPFFLFLLIAIPAAALFGALAFWPVNNRPFSIFLEAVYNYYTKTKLYLWKRTSLYTPKKVTNQSPYLPPQATHQGIQGGEEKLSTLQRQLELNSLNKQQ